MGPKNLDPGGLSPVMGGAAGEMHSPAESEVKWPETAFHSDLWPAAGRKGLSTVRRSFLFC